MTKISKNFRLLLEDVFFLSFIIQLRKGFDNMNKFDNDYYYFVARTNIKKYRTKKGISQQDLADKTNFSYQYIRDLECLSIIKRPRLDTLAIIANALEIELRQLFDDIDEK